MIMQHLVSGVFNKDTFGSIQAVTMSNIANSVTDLAMINKNRLMTSLIQKYSKHQRSLILRITDRRALHLEAMHRVMMCIILVSKCCCHVSVRLSVSIYAAHCGPPYECSKFIVWPMTSPA